MESEVLDQISSKGNSPIGLKLIQLNHENLDLKSNCD
jgi:hypothetical protein